MLKFFKYMTRLLSLTLLLSSCRSSSYAEQVDSRYIQILQECKPEMSSSEAATHLGILIELEDSFHELVACGQLTYTLIDSIAQMSSNAMFGQESSQSTSLSDLKHQDGMYVLEQPESGTVMKVKFGKELNGDFNVAEIGADLIDPSNYFSNPRAKIYAAEGEIRMTFEAPGPLAEQFDILSILGLDQGQNEMIYAFPGLKALTFLDDYLGKFTVGVDLLRGKLVITLDDPVDAPNAGQEDVDAVIDFVANEAADRVLSNVEVDLPEEFVSKYQAFQAKIDELKMRSFVDINQKLESTITYSTEIQPISIAKLKAKAVDPEQLKYKLIAISAVNESLEQTMQMSNESWEIKIDHITYQINTTFDFVIEGKNNYRLYGTFNNGQARLNRCEALINIPAR
jgi:hypothetical protein